MDVKPSVVLTSAVPPEEDSEDEVDYWVLTCGSDFDPSSLAGASISFEGTRRIGVSDNSGGKTWSTTAVLDDPTASSSSSSSDLIYVTRGKKNRFKTIQPSGSITVSRCVDGDEDRGEDEDDEVARIKKIVMQRVVTSHARPDVDQLPLRHGFFGQNYEKALRRIKKSMDRSSPAAKKSTKRARDESEESSDAGFCEPKKKKHKRIVV